MYAAFFSTDRRAQVWRSRVCRVTMKTLQAFKGKTLIARQIGKMLNAREPKIVNGPDILNKYVGESEANMRKQFVDAEEEQKRCGPNSGLHIIIFDEIDAICKQRGSAVRIREAARAG